MKKFVLETTGDTSSGIEFKLTDEEFKYSFEPGIGFYSNYEYPYGYSIASRNRC